MDSATFWAIFAQSHLVALAALKKTSYALD
jgi:hypothetical protein